jgi:hypothetical protein
MLQLIVLEGLINHFEVNHHVLLVQQVIIVPELQWIIQFFVTKVVGVLQILHQLHFVLLGLFLQMLDFKMLLSVFHAFQVSIVQQVDSQTLVVIVKLDSFAPREQQQTVQQMQHLVEVFVLLDISVQQEVQHQFLVQVDHIQVHQMVNPIPHVYLHQQVII